MRKIPLSAGLLTFLDSLEFTEAALSADDDAADLAPAFQEEIEGWELLFKKERIGRRGVVRADAVVAVRNAQLDDKTTRFGAAALAEAGGNRKSKGFRRFFSVAPSQFIRRALRKQADDTLNVLLGEIGKLDAQSPLKVFAQPLGDMATAAIQALDARNKAKADRTLANNDVDEWKEGVNVLRLTTYAELLKIAAEKDYGRAWADSFFQSDESDSADGGDPASQGTPATPPGGTPPSP
jgi:hypothetical protein